MFLQRTISLRNEAERAAPPPPSSTKTRVISATLSNPSSSMTAPRVSTFQPAAPASKRRDSKLWSETFDVRLGAAQPLSPKEIKRQEVKISEFLSVYFLFQSVQVHYFNSLF